MNFAPAVAEAPANADEEVKKVRLLGRIKNRVKKVYGFFGNRIFGRKQNKEEEAEMKTDMEIVANDQGLDQKKNKGGGKKKLYDSRRKPRKDSIVNNNN